MGDVSYPCSFTTVDGMLIYLKGTDWLQMVEN